MTLKVHIHSLEELSVFANTLKDHLQAGDVMALNGPLGSGKTALTSALAKACGATEHVTSPTFVLMHEYLSSTPPLLHVDFYRLGPEQSISLADDLVALIDEEQFLTIIEWAEYGDFIQSFVKVTIEFQIQEDESRILTISASDELLNQLEGQLDNGLKASASH